MYEKWENGGVSFTPERPVDWLEQGGAKTQQTDGFMNTVQRTNRRLSSTYRLRSAAAVTQLSVHTSCQQVR